MMPRKMLLRGQRCKTANQMKAYVHDYVRLHLLGSPGYKSIEELVEKLERIDPNPDSKWTRHRSYHHFVKVKAAMIAEQQGDDCKAGKQSADGAPEGDHTSGLDLALFDHAAASPEAPKSPPNPLGGRPKGTTKEAERAAKKANAALLDSAVKAWKQKREREGDTDAYITRGALKDIIDEKHTKFSMLNPGIQVQAPKADSVRRRVLRFESNPKRHSLEVGLHGRGPEPLLREAEEVLLNFMDEIAEFGIYLSGNELCQKMADLIHDTPSGDAFAQLAAKYGRCRRDRVYGRLYSYPRPANRRCARRESREAGGRRGTSGCGSHHRSRRTWGRGRRWKRTRPGWRRPRRSWAWWACCVEGRHRGARREAQGQGSY
jgi:hypothetical protein